MEYSTNINTISVYKIYNMHNTIALLLTKRNNHDIVLYKNKFKINMQEVKIFYMEEKKKASEAHMRATAKWEKENYDKVLVRFPKGTKEQITATGAKSVNGFIVEAVQEKLSK